VSPSTSADPWLQRWLPLSCERAAGSTPIFELGCGYGDDTLILTDAGFAVIALDRSPSNIEVAKTKAPAAEFLTQDMRAAFPARLSELGVVVASLSLHYFSWPETCALVERIGRCLRLGGVLLCRLNSTNDHHWGASGHPRIDEHYYLVNGEPKRFFDNEALDKLFAGWRVLAKEEMIIQRYDRPKVVWEIILERVI
jgi:SAM-dependent methyltransferase